MDSEGSEDGHGIRVLVCGRSAWKDRLEERKQPITGSDENSRILFLK
jgi:hypothetical protein